MSNQPEALRLADQLENDYYDGVRIPDAAAELRRQHTEIESLRAELLNITGGIARALAGDGLAEWADWAQNRARHAALKEPTT